MDDLPCLKAYISKDGVHLMACCDQCKKFHYHGVGTPEEVAWGHRIAHCTSAGAYKQTGYVLEPTNDIEYFQDFARQHRQLTHFKNTFKALQVNSPKGLLLNCLRVSPSGVAAYLLMAAN
jgi:hypothetical protein